jgi:hypothetical protein
MGASQCLEALAAVWAPAISFLAAVVPRGQCVCCFCYFWHMCTVQSMASSCYWLRKCWNLEMLCYFGFACKFAWLCLLNRQMSVGPRGFTWHA